MKLLFILCVFCTLCMGKSLQIEAEFLPYVRAFQAGYYEVTGQYLHATRLKVYLDDFVVEATTRFARTQRVAECRDSESEHPEIVLRRDLGWGGFSELRREQVLYHELGHCLLQLDHQAGTIMAEVMLGEDIYKLNRSKLIHHLFLSGKAELDYRRQLVDQRHKLDEHNRRVLNFLIDNDFGVSFEE